MPGICLDRHPSGHNDENGQHGYRLFYKLRHSPCSVLSLTYNGRVTGPKTRAAAGSCYVGSEHNPGYYRSRFTGQAFQKIRLEPTEKPYMAVIPRKQNDRIVGARYNVSLRDLRQRRPAFDMTSLRSE